MTNSSVQFSTDPLANFKALAFHQSLEENVYRDTTRIKKKDQTELVIDAFSRTLSHASTSTLPPKVFFKKELKKLVLAEKLYMKQVKKIIDDFDTAYNKAKELAQSPSLPQRIVHTIKKLLGLRVPPTIRQTSTDVPSSVKKNVQFSETTEVLEYAPLFEKEFTYNEESSSELEPEAQARVTQYNQVHHFGMLQLAIEENFWFQKRTDEELSRDLPQAILLAHEIYNPEIQGDSKATLTPRQVTFALNNLHIYSQLKNKENGEELQKLAIETMRQQPLLFPPYNPKRRDRSSQLSPKETDPLKILYRKLDGNFSTVTDPALFKKLQRYHHLHGYAKLHLSLEQNKAFQGLTEEQQTTAIKVAHVVCNRDNIKNNTGKFYLKIENVVDAIEYLKSIDFKIEIQ